MTRFLVLILVSQLLSPSPAMAFKWFWQKDKKASESQEEVLLNEEVVINSKYRSVDGIFDVKLIIHIPHNSEEVKVISFDDELNEVQIDQINWLVEQNPNKKIIHKLFQPVIIKAYKTETNVNEAYESHAVDFNPDKAYDRIADDKHLVNKSFSFEKKKIFKNNKERIAHFLELTFSNGLKKSIRIEEKIYQEPIDITSGIFPSQESEEGNNPYEKYSEILRGNQGLDADLDAAAAKEERLNFSGDGGYSPLEYKVLPEAGIPADGGASDFYTDPSGQSLDESLLDLY